MAEPFPQFCSRCGSSLQYREIEGRKRAYCPSCTEPRYRNPRPCAGVLVVEDSTVLLVERTVPPAVGCWSLPAGYMEYDETGTEAAVRELGEETGLSVRESALSLFTTNHVTHPDGWTVLVLVYTVSRDQTDGDPVARSDAAAARFWDLDELADEGEQLEPSYHEIVAGAIEREQTATDETRVHH